MIEQRIDSAVARHGGIFECTLSAMSMIVAVVVEVGQEVDI